MRTFKGPYSAEFPSPNAPIDTRYVFVCVDTGMIPFLAQALTPLLRRSAWASEEDFLAARQKLLEFKAALMNGCDSAIVRDGFVMLAKALSLNYTEQLEGPLPGLAAALYDAEQADTAGAMDAIHRFGDAAATQDANFAALGALIQALLTDGTLTPSLMLLAFDEIKTGGGTALARLQSLLDNSIGLNSNQNEYFLRDIAGLIGGVVGLPPLDQP